MIYAVANLHGNYSKFKELISYGTSQALQEASNERITMILLFALAALAALSILHFLCTAAIEDNKSAKRANFGLCTVLFLALYSVYLYFNTNLPINAPNKIIDQMAVLLCAVFFLYETRLSIGREKWRQYIAFGFIAARLCAYSSIPNIIVYFARSDFEAGIEVTLSNSIYETALVFALFIFITARLLLAGELIEDKESPIVCTMICSANERADAIAPKAEEPTKDEPEREEADDNQISIEELANEITPQNEDSDTTASEQFTQTNEE